MLRSFRMRGMQLASFNSVVGAGPVEDHATLRLCIAKNSGGPSRTGVPSRRLSCFFGTVHVGFLVESLGV